MIWVEAILASLSSNKNLKKTELIFQKGLDDPINLKNDQFQIAITYSLKL
jgi:hypothetical protein